VTALWRSAASGRYEDDLALCWLVRGPAERRTEGAADKRGDEVNAGGWWVPHAVVTTTIRLRFDGRSTALIFLIFLVEKRFFQHGGSPIYWIGFVVISSHCIREFYVPNIVLNFQVA